MLDWEPAATELAGRNILITGAGTGIGRALAKAAAGLGATVILVGPLVPELEAVYDEITTAGGPEPMIHPMDFKEAEPLDFEAAAGGLYQAFGPIHGLVNNAAYLGPLSPLPHYEPELWDLVMRIDLRAPYLLTRACLPLLTAAEDASIVFLSDRVGRHGRAYWGAYGAAKAGLENLMQTLADELEANTAVRVNSYDPGPVRTALRYSAYPAEDRAVLPAPEDVVRPLLYLLSPASRGITGRQWGPPDRNPA